MFDLIALLFFFFFLLLFFVVVLLLLLLFFCCCCFFSLLFFLTFQISVVGIFQVLHEKRRLHYKCSVLLLLKYFGGTYFRGVIMDKVKCLITSNFSNGEIRYC